MASGDLQEVLHEQGITSVKSIIRNNGVRSSLSGRQLNVTLHDSVRSGSFRAIQVGGDDPTSE